MRFFIDSAKVEDIRMANDLGAVCGVVTSLSRIAGEGQPVEEALVRIAFAISGPVVCEVGTDAVDAGEIVAQARGIAGIRSDMVVRIPMTVEGMKAYQILAAEGIKVDVAMTFSANQALQAARAGAAYVSPFMGRLHGVNQRGVELIRETADLFAVCEVDTQIIATVAQDPAWIVGCETAGANIVAAPYSAIEQMAGHTQSGANAGGTLGGRGELPE